MTACDGSLRYLSKDKDLAVIYKEIRIHSTLSLVVLIPNWGRLNMVLSHLN